MMPSKTPEKAFPVSWDQFHRDARALAWRLNGAGPFAAIVTVTRGGLVPAAIVARELDIRVIETISIASYDHTRQGELRVLKGVASSAPAALASTGSPAAKASGPAKASKASGGGSAAVPTAPSQQDVMPVPPQSGQG